MTSDQSFIQHAIELLGQVIPDVVLHLDDEGLLVHSYAGSSEAPVEPLVRFHGMNVHDCAALISWSDPELTRRLREALDTTLHTREHSHVTFHIRWPHEDSSLRYYDMRAIPFGTQTLVLIRDTTSEHILQEQLTISERMASLGTLAAGVAHEINNPLTYIQCNLVLAIEELEELGTLPEIAHLSERLDALREVKESLGVALEGTQRVAKITSELKHFSRIHAVKSRPIDLADIIDSAIQLSSNELRHRAELHTHTDASLSPTFGDPHQLTQVFVNLLMNAAQSFDGFDTDMPTITITLSQLDEHTLCARIADNGKGMTPDTLRRIFDPFFTTKPNMGTGLGLSVSHRIVNDLGGSLAAESSPGQGCVITVTLPSSSSLHTISSEPQLTLDSPRATGSTILIIEDEPLIQTLLERLLDHHDVHLFASLHDAIPALDVITPHAIICDLMLPGEGGELLHAHLKTHAPDLIQRTLFITGGAFTPGAEFFLKIVRPRLLQKPFKNQDLLREIDAILHLP